MTLLDDKIVQIRKTQKCFGCAREFNPPSKLQLLVRVDSGHFSRTYWCEVCRAYWNKYMDSDDEIFMGDLKDCGEKNWEYLRVKIEEALRAEGQGGRK